MQAHEARKEGVGTTGHRPVPVGLPAATAGLARGSNAAAVGTPLLQVHQETVRKEGLPLLRSHQHCESLG